MAPSRPLGRRYGRARLPPALTKSQLQKMKEEAAQRQKARLAAMSAQETVSLAHLQSDHMVDDAGDWANDIQMGTETLQISYAGGELDDMELGQALLKDVHQHRKKRKDYRLRRNRTQKQAEGFAKQLPDMVLSYRKWFRRIGGNFTKLRGEEQEEDGTVQGTRDVQVVDIFDTYKYVVTLSSSDQNIPASFVHHGLIPCSPFEPSVAVTIRTLEEFRTLHMYCPRLTIEAFTKALCLRLGVCFRRYLAHQLQTSYDVYLAILRASQYDIMNTLGRGDPMYRIRNCCPACTYRLEDEEPLQFRLLWSMDGNDSLKRFKRSWVTQDDNGNDVYEDAERTDLRSCHDNYFVSRAKVDEFELSVDRDENNRNDRTNDNEDIEGSPCEKHWHNMRNDKTSSMWRVYDETGLFMATCRHGFVLKCADMVQSGEKSKYALSIIDEMLRAHGSDQGGAYDVGCRFKKTIALSSLSAEAQNARFMALVGTWHGFAHSRICQVHNLGIYVPGRGLDPLDTLESKFSRTNHLTSSTRHASRFHRQQEIITYLQHTDRHDSYEHLPSTMRREYGRALEHLVQGQGRLELAMEHLGLQDPSVFEKWLDEEREYLQRLQDEPIEETQQMRYYSALLQYYQTQSQVNAMKESFNYSDPSATPYGTDVRWTQKTEAERMKLLEDHDTNIIRVYTAEGPLGISSSMRWKPDSPEWKATEKLVRERRVRKAVDRLELLVISRGQELYKARMGDTGYSMRKSIARHLKSRSKALGPAIDEYNAAAASFSSTHPQITLEELLDHETLADFDILRGTRDEIASKPWAKPAARRAMDDYFRIQRARETIQRLNIEIRRLATYMQDEEEHLLQQESIIGTSDPDLAFQIGHYRQQRSRYREIHQRELAKISGLPGFSGCVTPGIALHRSPPVRETSIGAQDPQIPTGTGDILLDLTDLTESDAEEVENFHEEEEQGEQEMDDLVTKISALVEL